MSMGVVGLGHFYLYIMNFDNLTLLLLLTLLCVVVVTGSLSLRPP
jgi:hypothetical protein